MRHGNCKRSDGEFDSDLCTCGCAAVSDFVSAAEIAVLNKPDQFGNPDHEAETNVRALTHARAVNARASRKRLKAQRNAIKAIRLLRKQAVQQ